MLSPLALETCTQIALRPSAFTQMLTLTRFGAWDSIPYAWDALSPLGPLPSPPSGILLRASSVQGSGRSFTSEQVWCAQTGGRSKA